MIAVDLIWAISFLISFALLLVFVLWIFYNFFEEAKSQDVASSADLEQCPYCLSLFFDYQKSDVKTCPHCKSYVGGVGNKSEKGRGKK